MITGNYQNDEEFLQGFFSVSQARNGLTIFQGEELDFCVQSMANLETECPESLADDVTVDIRLGKGSWKEPYKVELVRVPSKSWKGRTCGNAIENTFRSIGIGPGNGNCDRSCQDRKKE